MSKFSIDKTAPNVNNTQNPYDFNGVSVSQFSRLILCSLNPHHQATSVALSEPAVSPLEPASSVSVPP